VAHLGLLLFVSPIQHRAPVLASIFARAASAEGHRVTFFLLGDGVYNSSRALAESSPENPVRLLAELPDSVTMINCSTCARFRGLEDADLLPRARNGTLEDLTDLLEQTDRFLTFAQEGFP